MLVQDAPVASLAAFAGTGGEAGGQLEATGLERLAREMDREGVDTCGDERGGDTFETEVAARGVDGVPEVAAMAGLVAESTRHVGHRPIPIICKEHEWRAAKGCHRESNNNPHQGEYIP